MGEYISFLRKVTNSKKVTQICAILDTPLLVMSVWQILSISLLSNDKSISNLKVCFIIIYLEQKRISRAISFMPLFCNMLVFAREYATVINPSKTPLDLKWKFQIESALRPMENNNGNKKLSQRKANRKTGKIKISKRIWNNMSTISNCSWDYKEMQFHGLPGVTKR